MNWTCLTQTRAFFSWPASLVPKILFRVLTDAQQIFVFGCVVFGTQCLFVWVKTPVFMKCITLQLLFKIIKYIHGIHNWQESRWLGWEKDKQNGKKFNKNARQTHNVVKESLNKNMVSYVPRFCIWWFVLMKIKEVGIM